MSATSTAITVHVRGIPPDVWQAMRVEAVQRGISVAMLLQVMWHDWSRDHSIVVHKTNP